MALGRTLENRGRPGNFGNLKVLHDSFLYHLSRPSASISYQIFSFTILYLADGPCGFGHIAYAQSVQPFST